MSTRTVLPAVQCGHPCTCAVWPPMEWHTCPTCCMQAQIRGKLSTVQFQRQIRVEPKTIQMSALAEMVDGDVAVAVEQQDPFGALRIIGGIGAQLAVPDAQPRAAASIARDTGKDTMTPTDLPTAPRDGTQVRLRGKMLGVLKKVDEKNQCMNTGIDQMVDAHTRMHASKQARTHARASRHAHTLPGHPNPVVCPDMPACPCQCVCRSCRHVCPSIHVSLSVCLSVCACASVRSFVHVCPSARARLPACVCASMHPRLRH